MVRPRERRKITRKPNINIQFLLEGETEEYFFREYLKDSGYKLRIQIDTLRSGSYRNFITHIEKNKSIYDIVIIVADLDRASPPDNELDNLKKLIRLLEGENPKNNLFLTYENLETFFSACLPKLGTDNLETYLGYSKGSKGKEDIYDRLKRKDIDFKLAGSKFRENDLFYVKKNFIKGVIDENNIRKKQSNLTYFIEYIKNIVESV
jgi:hypothetical protein